MGVGPTPRIQLLSSSRTTSPTPHSFTLTPNSISFLRFTNHHHDTVSSSMGCVSSTFLSHPDADDFTQMGGSSAAFGHHIVSLTSTTYGLLTLDPPPPPPSPPSSSSPTVAPTPPPRFTLGSLFPSPPLPSKPEIINSWELMAGLDSHSTPLADHSFRLSPLPPNPRKENSHPNLLLLINTPIKHSDDVVLVSPRNSSPLDSFENPKFPLINKYDVVLAAPKSSLLDSYEKLCPPNGEGKVVIYTTTLRGIRKTFEACNAVRSAIEGLGFVICERDISMDQGFKEELKELMKGKDNSSEMVPPRVFINGRYIGGVEEVMRVLEEGGLGELLKGLPKIKSGGYVCEGCGGVRFLPCFKCNGSCKMVIAVEEEMMVEKRDRTVVVRCTDCNENGLVLCPICS